MFNNYRHIGNRDCAGLHGMTASDNSCSHSRGRACLRSVIGRLGSGRTGTHICICAIVINHVFLAYSFFFFLCFLYFLLRLLLLLLLLYYFSVFILIYLVVLSSPHCYCSSSTFLSSCLFFLYVMSKCFSAVCFPSHDCWYAIVVAP